AKKDDPSWPQERPLKSSTFVGSEIPVSGAPSPEPYESPIAAHTKRVVFMVGVAKDAGVIGVGSRLRNASVVLGSIGGTVCATVAVVVVVIVPRISPPSTIQPATICEPSPPAASAR